MTYEDFIAEWESDTPYIEVETSGSTGTPKRIRLDRDFVVKSALRTNSFFGIDSTSRLHSCISPDFIGGKMMAVRKELAGCRLSWEEPSNRPLRQLGRYENISLLAVVPSQMIDILDRINEIPQIEAVIIGGGALSRNLRMRIASTGLNAYETYGMTETASHIALKKVSMKEGWFETLPGIHISQDERGCLIIKFSDETGIVTNDLCELKSETEFRIIGRVDHVIVTGGKKVNPLDVENRISELIPFPFVITSVPDEKWGSKVIMKIESGDVRIDKEELSVKMRGLLKGWEIPKEILMVKELERTKNGKVKR